MASFVSKAGRSASDIRQFLKEAGNAGGIKYRAVAGTQHLIYFPFEEQPVIGDDGNPTGESKRGLKAITGKVHEWTDPAGRYHATICTKDVVIKGEDGTLVNDGTCPFCDRVADAWDVYNYRMEMEKATCTKTGKELESHMDAIKTQLAKERKISDARDYAYILCALFTTAPGAAAGTLTPVLDEKGLPKFELKVMKLSANRVETIETQVTNSTGKGMAGSEIIIDYPQGKDQMTVVKDSRISPVFGAASILDKYPDVLNAINAEVAKFDWEGIEKSFQEWEGMSVARAKSVMDEQFRKWDAYKAELEMNPQARYMEYGLGAAAAMPSLGAPTAAAPAVGLPDPNALFNPGAAAGMGIPTAAGIPVPGVPGAPEVPQAPVAPGVPGVGNPTAGIPTGPVTP